MVKLTRSIIEGRVKQGNVDILRKLNVWGCDIDDISILENMTTLEILSLSVNHISNLQPLSGLMNLRELYLRKNEITDLSEVEHLKGLRKLRVLWLDDNPCADQPDYRKTVLQNLPFLKTLDNRVVRADEVKDFLMESEEESVPPPPHPPPQVHIPPIGEVAFYAPSGMTQSFHPSLPSSMSQSFHPVYHQQGSPYYTIQQHPPQPPPSDIMSTSMSGFIPISARDHPTNAEDSWISFEDGEEQDQVSHSLNDSSFNSRFGMRRSINSGRSLNRRSRSVSPTRIQRLNNVMTAIFHLLDELDAEGLRAVIDDCHDRIKKRH